MDELKKYFRQQEAEMEVETPDEKRMWERLQAHWQKKKLSKRVVMFTVGIAAAACIALLIVVGLFINEDKRPVKQKEIAQNTVPAIKDSAEREDGTNKTEQPVAARQVKRGRNQALTIQPLKEERPFGGGYAQLIYYQIKRLRSIPVYAESPEYFTYFKLQLQQMDADEALLKNDIQEYGMNDQLLEALINIYQQKLNLLKSLKGEINKMNKTTREKQIQGKLPYYLNI